MPSHSKTLPTNERKGAYHSLLILTALLLLMISAGSSSRAFADPPSPEEYFGFELGADRKLVSYDQTLPYYEALADSSDRILLETIGQTTLGRDLVMLTISTPENLANLDTYREIASQLHDPRGLSSPEIAGLVDQGKAILMVNHSIHSNEIITSQLAPAWAHALATRDELLSFLEETIVLLIPSANPDGQEMVTNWYRQTLGTISEGSNLPWLYHPYAGHDNNRDWFMLNLAETRSINAQAYKRWYPQVILDHHQMGMTGPRIFVPPYADPVSDRVHPLIFREADLIGASIALRLEQSEKTGAIYGYMFDAYWPGGTRSTPWWKNTVGVLVEIASCRLATPIRLEPGELTGGVKGLADYRMQVNFPNPWPGGWWRPKDILEYGLITSNATLETVSKHRQDILWGRARMARNVMETSGVERPRNFVIPPNQHDPTNAAALVDILRMHGLEAFQTQEAKEQEGYSLPKGSVLFSTRQPYANLLMELMVPHDYPEIRVSANARATHDPYDVTAWCLPLMMGTNVIALDGPLRVRKLEVTGNTWEFLNWGSETSTSTQAWYALSPEATANYQAVFRLLQQRVPVQQVPHSMRAPSGPMNALKVWPAGTFLVRGGDNLDQVARETQAVVTRVDVSEAQSLETPSSTAGIDRQTVSLPRLGLYQSWVASTDEGWTRLMLDRNEVPYAILQNQEIFRGNLQLSYDAILIPEHSYAQLLHGYRGGPDARFGSRRPSQFSGGLAGEGVEALRQFVLAGGTLITLGESCHLPLTKFDLPVSRMGGDNPPQGMTFGTLLRAEVNANHPLGYGMPKEAAVFHTSSPVFLTELPVPGRDRSVVMRYPADGKLVLSGRGKHTEQLRRKAALVEAQFGAGKVVLFGFRPQFRGQTRGTYRLVFNALIDAASSKS